MEDSNKKQDKQNKPKISDEEWVRIIEDTEHMIPGFSDIVYKRIMDKRKTKLKQEQQK